MLDDLLAALAWSLVLWAGVIPTLHLYQNLGVLVASQSSIMSIAALIDALLIKRGFAPMGAFLVTLVAGAGLGLIHLPVFLQTRAAALLVLTAISQIVLVEAWYAAPETTGGSGGLLVPKVDITQTTTLLCVLVALFNLYILYLGKLPRKKFDWASLRTIGLKSEAFGVPARRDYLFGFVAYGIILAAGGVAAARFVGSLAVGYAGLSWSLTTLMIALAASTHSIFLGVILALLYSTIRVLLRQTVEASGALSAFFEILFPVALFFIISLNSLLINVSVQTKTADKKEEN